MMAERSELTCCWLCTSYRRPARNREYKLAESRFDHSDGRFHQTSRRSHSSCLNQCVLFSRIIGQVTPKINYFYNLKKIFSGSKYPKIILFNFEKGSNGLNRWSCHRIKTHVGAKKRTVYCQCLFNQKNILSQRPWWDNAWKQWVHQLLAVLLF